MHGFEGRNEMGIQDIIAIAVALAALAYILRILIRSFTTRGGCACDTTRSSADGTTSATRTGLKRTPLVTIDQFGTPSAKPDTNMKS
jgi:hypothetical protein